jgi:hypothetical protein
MPREKFLTVYDYGQGGVWRILLAESQDQIERELPQLRILGGPPDWMTEAELAAVRIVDIDSKDDDFLNQLRRNG